MMSLRSLDHLMVFVMGLMIAHRSLVKCCFSDRLKRLNALGSLISLTMTVRMNVEVEN